ncbi:MAG: hypothetical protein RDV41_04940 [Planctomycetota bacterium]|nr:hypothetical protein [Planctomycetota bacterium]
MITSFEARAAISTDGFPRSGSFEGILKYRHPDGVRLRAFRSPGPTVFDFSIVDGECTLLLPSEKKMLKGGAAAGPRSAADSVGAAVFPQLFMWIQPPDSSLLPRIDRCDDGRIRIAYTENGRIRRRTTIDASEEPRILEEELIDDAGRVVLHACFSEYRRSGDLLFPARVEAKGVSAAGPFRILAVVREAKLNLPLEDVDFEIELPEGFALERDAF